MGSWQVSPNLGLAGVVGWSKITGKSLFCYPLSRDVGPNGATAEYFLSAGWGWGGHISIWPNLKALHFDKRHGTPIRPLPNLTLFVHIF